MDTRETWYPYFMEQYTSTILLEKESRHHTTVVLTPSYFGDLVPEDSRTVRVTHIFSSYPGHIFPDDALETLMIKTKLEGFKLKISRALEPNILWDCALPESRNLFEVIHDAMKKTGFPVKDLMLYVGNNSIEKSYDMWCNFNRIPKRNRIDVKITQFWTRGVNRTYTEVDCFNGLEDKLRTRYFTCFNGRMRYQKKDIARYFYNTGFFNTYKRDKAYFSFVFDSVPEDDPFFTDNPGLLDVLPRSIEENKPWHPRTRHWDGIRHEIMATEKFSEVQQDSYFDLAVDFVQNEDWWWPSYTQAVKQWPWWTEHIVSEKVVRNIKNRRPFIIIGEAFSLEFLKTTFGMKTFDFMFDESYDLITNYTVRYRNVLQQVTSLTESTKLEELHKILYSAQMEDVLEHNYEQLKVVGTYFDELEAQELRDFVTPK